MATATPLTELAGLLRELRLRAGSPSFRELAERTRKLGNPVAHTSIHHMTVGRHLPSWPDVEVVLTAIGVDPEKYRDQWLAAARWRMNSKPGPSNRQITVTLPAFEAAQALAAQRVESVDAVVSRAILLYAASQQMKP